MNRNQSASPSLEVSQIVPIPGLHIVANLAVQDKQLLLQSSFFKNFIVQKIDEFQLSMVGNVFYDFPGGGFTAVLCLTESHLSIHTWPEHHYLTFDVFLSNYLKDNREKTREVYHSVVDFFSADILYQQILER